MHADADRRSHLRRGRRFVPVYRDTVVIHEPIVRGNLDARPDRAVSPRASETEPDQVAVIPVRATGTDVEVCLIRRNGRRHWGIPKGFIDDGKTAMEAALTEAREEAGVLGRIVGDAIGTYEYEKWDDRLLVAVYVMRVVDVLPVWDEMDLRERRWTTVADAEHLLRRHPVLPVWESVSADFSKIAGRR
jgi:8-oxo-dGTP pyrophosphatase MutT (NUDIX family)